MLAKTNATFAHLVYCYTICIDSFSSKRTTSILWSKKVPDIRVDFNNTVFFFSKNGTKNQFL